MITADTITDEQIRELLAEAGAHAYPGSANRWRDQYESADVALYAIYPGDAREHLHASAKYKARARCAAILNARSTK